MTDREEGVVTRTFDDWIMDNSSSMTIDVSVGDELTFNYKINSGALIVTDSHMKTYMGDSGTYQRVFEYAGRVTISAETYTSCEITGMKLKENGNLSLGSNDGSPLFADCPLDSVYIGRNIAYRYSPFYHNTSLRSVVITDKETEISENEFYGCTNLKNVRIGDEVTKIGDWAFSGCSSLDYFAFGRRVESIGKEAFSDCTAVTNIISHADTPPACGTEALDDINKWNCMLTVPKGKLDAYMAVEQWKEFFFVVEGTDSIDGPVVPNKKECAKPTIYFANGKLSFKSETEGVEFVSEIKDVDIKKSYGSEIDLSVTYHISVYATKSSYGNSETATATLCWINVEPQKEGITEDVVDAFSEVKAMPVLMQFEGSSIAISDAEEGVPISVYDLSGKLLGSTMAVNGITRVQVANIDKVVIVKIGERSVKVVK